MGQNKEQGTQLSDLPNIGPVLENQLREVGILTADDLHQTGTKEAWLRIQQIDSSACIHRLQALEGAITGVKKSQLSTEVKADLREFYQRHKL